MKEVHAVPIEFSYPILYEIMSGQVRHFFELSHRMVIGNSHQFEIRRLKIQECLYYKCTIIYIVEFCHIQVDHIHVFICCLWIFQQKLPFLEKDNKI